MEKTNFWEKLKLAQVKGNKPFFCLAPMADVTDAPFRKMIAKYSGFTRTDGSRGGPDVIWTEMVSCDGLMHERLNGMSRSNLSVRERLSLSFIYDKIERPIVAQIFGSNPDTFLGSAKLLKKLKSDGIDINMGCPDQGINKQNAGASLINNPKLAQEIILATKEGAGTIPVSVKTRIGYNKNVIEEWLPKLLEAKPSAITIHGRTKKEMSKVPVHWDIIKRGVEIAKGSGVLIIGNGDVKSIEEGLQRAEESGVDGIMVGRGVFGNPWFFNEKIKKSDLSLKKILAVLLEHAKLFEKTFGDNKPFVLMRKHFGSYICGFPGAKELRIKLMGTECANDVKKIIMPYIK